MRYFCKQKLDIKLRIPEVVVFHLSGTLGLSHGKYEEITSRYLHQGVSIITNEYGPMYHSNIHQIFLVSHICCTPKIRV